MKYLFVIGALFAAAALAPLSASRAALFSLDGRFECLASGAATCGDARPLALPPPPPAVAAAAAAELEAPIPAIPAAIPMHAVATTAASAPAVAPRSDPLQTIAARVKARRPSSNDLAWLAQAARAGNTRAIELLAWCKLNAIGMARDPVAAYLLYGAASDAALPHARDNQRLIYERDLNSDQRQQVLDLANDGVTLAGLMPAAP